jgi:hypothetical protein
MELMMWYRSFVKPWNTVGIGMDIYAKTDLQRWRGVFCGLQSMGAKFCRGAKEYQRDHDHAY